jgi:DNA invertase Pin-like site-specific DNA recombinase
LKDARSRRFDSVCVYKLDRFGRSLRDCLNHLREMELHGVRFLSVTQGIDTGTGQDSAGRFLLHILAAAAEFERELIRERVTAGMQAAKRRGAQLGHPKAVLGVGDQRNRKPV